MKNKRSHVPARKVTSSGEASDFPLPSPLELARLAAMLRPDAPSSPDALKAAVRCYFEAVLFAREQAASEIAALLSNKQKDERRKKEIEDIKKKQAATWADTVTFDEARELLANPRKLAQRLDKLPKEGEPLPEPRMIVETPLHELPGVRPSPRSKDKREKLQTDSALITNAVKARAYQLRKIGAKDDPQENRDFLEMLRDSQRIPVFLLETILRHRHEKAKKSKRDSVARKKARKKNRASNFCPDTSEKL